MYDAVVVNEAVERRRPAVHYSSVQPDTVSHLTVIGVKGWHALSGGILSGAH